MLEQDAIEQLADELCAAGWSRGMTFAEKANRDAVAKAARQRGAVVKKSSIRNQLMDPRYTIESRHLPDKGLANDYRHYWPALYMLERTL